MQLIRQFDLEGQLHFIGDTEAKLAELYSNNPSIKKDNKTAIIEYWKTYEGLSKLLGEKLYAFEQWFLNKCTSPETIARCQRILKDSGAIKLSDSEQSQRQESREHHRQYWSNRRNGGH